MKKIYILTIHRCLNFGSVLQAFALKKVLEKLQNNPVELIDYINKKINSTGYSIINRSGVFKFINSLLTIKYRYHRRNKINEFLKLYVLNSNQNKYNNESITKICDAGLFIIGSDQVWNYDITGKDKTYLLDFVSDNIKKASYASSFGFQEMFDNNKEDFLHLLQLFNNISLRESIGYNEISKLNKETHIHLDPTFLISKDEWSQFVTKSDEQYILIYTTLRANKLYNFANKLSKLTGLRILEIASSPIGLIYNLKSKILMDKSPEECISLIANAKYILTTSFHGTVFSIIFRKKFFSEINCKGKYNYRVKNLLKLLNLENRAIEIVNENIFNDIDWNAVDTIINQEKEKSLEYLKHICEV